MSYGILYGRDYPLNNVRTFENYLFVVSKGWKEVHKKYDGMIRGVDENGKIVEFPCNDEKQRKAARDWFNGAWQNKKISFKGRKIGCLLIDMQDNDNKYDEDDILAIYTEVCEVIIDWAAGGNRVCVVVPHLYQMERGSTTEIRLPHLHVIYEKKSNETDALTHFLDSKLPD